MSSQLTFVIWLSQRGLRERPLLVQPRVSRTDFSPGSLRIGLLRLQSELGGSKKVIMKMLSDIECGPGIGSCGGVRFEGLYQ